MGSVTIKNGIGFSEESGARYIDMAAISDLTTAAAEIRQVPPPKDLNARKWSPWGANNLKPIEMTLDIETCGILNTIVDGKARFAMGAGMVPAITKTDEKTGQKVIEKYLNVPEINDFLEGNNHFFHTYAWMKDGLGFSNGVARYGLSKGKDRKVVTFQRDDVTEFRYEKKDDKGKTSNIWLSADWQKVYSESSKNVFSVPLLDINNPTADLQKKISGGATSNEYAMTFKYPAWNKQYYSVPLWYAAYKWVKIAQGVPDMKAVMFENNMRVKYIVIIQESYWPKAFGADNWKNYTDTQRKAKIDDVYDDIDKFLIGSKNAYKSIFTTGYRDRDGKTYTDIEIKPVEDTSREGELLPDSAAANSEISFAMLFNNAIIGGNQASGLYEQSQGGSSVRESVLLQVIIHEFERHIIRRIMSVPKFVNGWNVTYPGLDFIIPTTLLTTLDTGAGTKPVIPGNTNPKDNGADKNQSGN